MGLKGLTKGSQAEIELYRKDIEEMRQGISDLRSQKMPEDDFKKFRLQRGIYGQKQKPDIQMVRIKVPWGRITAEQMETIADASDTFAGKDRKGISHVTTRQAIQLHFVSLDRIPECMDKLRASGLTTREACANTVRNVTADPLAGVAGDEAFDISPYAEATARYFLRHPVSQTLARKFKIAFSGSTDDRGLNFMHDVGCLAHVQKVGSSNQVGFKITVGGGLGPTPKLAKPLEDFTPADQLLNTIHAILFVFNRDWDYGRKNRNMARMKFLIEKIGIEEFRKRVFTERENLKSEKYPNIEIFEEEKPTYKSAGGTTNSSKEFLRWKETNVIAQKQSGFSAVTIKLTLGDIKSSQFKALAGLTRKYSNGSARTTVQQNFVIRWVSNDALTSLYQDLTAIGLSNPSAGRLGDITCCPGADTCQLGITSSRGLATALGNLFMNGRSSDADLKDIKIKISGCPNSCGQHHIADIGFFGGAKTIDGHQVPTYSMLLGGHYGQGESGYGKHFLRVPARRIPDVVSKLLDIYKERKESQEKFRHFIQRIGFEPLKKELEPLTNLSTSTDKNAFSDWGETGEFQVSTGQGECAA